MFSSNSRLKSNFFHAIALSAGLLFVITEPQANTPLTSTVLSDQAVACEGKYGQPGVKDTDKDGIADIVEGTDDFDGDGLANYLDTDSDNDGISDTVEHGFVRNEVDKDGDGKTEWFDSNDEDANNTCTRTNVGDPIDTDGDGSPEYLDNVGTAYTAQTDPCVAVGGYSDSDRDFIPDFIEGNVDTDGDLIPDYLDRDSDNDGLSDRVESGFMFLSEDLIDSDSDGYWDELEFEPYDRNNVCATLLIEPVDRDLSGTPDYLEPASYAPDTHNCKSVNGEVDTDGDLIPDVVETDQDVDQDGIPNYLDLDSDNDNISDILENFGVPWDINLDSVNLATGVPYIGVDADNDGLNELVDTNDGDRKERCLKITSTPHDTNNDGIPDYLDADIDDDGLYDGLERHYYGTNSLDTDNDGISDFDEMGYGTNPGKVDSDGGGVDDWWEIFQEANPVDASDDATIPVDQDIDNDGIPNGLEYRGSGWTDSDSDGLSDAREAGFPDEDNNGIIDDLTDTNKNGIPDIAETGAPLPDFDNDGVPDFWDRDSDQDGVPDQFEHGAVLERDNPLNTVMPSLDVDSDGLINSHDLDSDNDGISDFEETGPRMSEYGNLAVWPYTLTDSNGDGRVDEMDDIDNDGIQDIVSAIHNPAEPDTDNDGIIDKADYDQVRYSDLDSSGYNYIMVPGRDDDSDGIENRHDPDPSGRGLFPIGDLVIVDSDGDTAPNWLDYDDNDSSVIFQSDIQTPTDTTAPTNTNTQEPETQQANQPPSNGGGAGSLNMLFALLMMVIWRRKS